MRQTEKLVGPLYGETEQSHRRKIDEMPLIHILNKREVQRPNAGQRQRLQPIAECLAGLGGIILIEESLDPSEIRQIGAHVFEQNPAQDVNGNKGKDISYRLSENQ